MRPLWSSAQRVLSHGHHALWPVIEQFSSPASQLILAPLLLSRVGAEQFGLWVLVLSILFGAPLLSLGRSSTLMVMIPQLVGRSIAVSGLVWHVLFRIGVSTALVLVAGLLFSRWLPGTGSFDALTRSIYVGLAVLLLAATEIDNTLACALRGFARFKLAAGTETAGRALHVLACFVCVTPGSSVLTVLWVTLAVAAAKASLKFVSLRAVVAGQATGESSSALNADASRHEMLRLGRWNCLQVFSGLTFYAFDRWLVGFVAGAAALGSYAICSQYAQFAHSIAAAAGQPLIPWMARHTSADGSAGDPVRVRRVALGAAVLCCLPVALAGLLGGPALSLWIDPAFAVANETLVHRLSWVFLLLAINVPFINLLLGLKQSRFVALLTLTAGLWLIVSTWLWRPGDALGIANLKLGYAALALLSVARLMWLLRRPRVG